MYVVLVIGGIFLHYALLLLIVTLSFWIVRAQGLVYGYYNLFQIARIPAEAFLKSSKFVYLLFSYVLPMLIVANYPAKVLGFNMSNLRMLWVLGLVAVFVWIASRFWRFALRSYTSASS
jgi:ABC-2 type transport system permease protein